MFTLVFATMSAANTGYPLVTIPMVGVAVGALTFVLRRFGLLAGAVGALWPGIVTHVPLTADLSSWYAAPTIMALVVLGAVAIYGFRVALAGRSAIRLMSEEAA